MERFTLTADHIKLLRRMCVGWQDCETGAPEIDPKRPYGNSGVAQDVVEILGWPALHDDCEHAECSQAARDAQETAALELHRETEVALQLVLAFGSFAPGEYCRSNGWSEWRAAAMEPT